jgi:hypothetical protein
MVAGVEMGGDMGGDMGGAELPERVGMGDTAGLRCESDEYCPSARLSGLSMPGSRSDATTAGCRLAGNENGASLGALLMTFIGGTNLDEYVTPDADGNISLILLNHLEGWTLGATGNEAGAVTANFYVGDRTEAGELFIDPASLDDSGAPYISFPETTITDGLLRTPVSSFALSLPLFPGFELALSLENASLEGDVSVNEVGFGLTDGVLGGYLTKDSLAAILEGIYTACGIGRAPAGEVPDFCGTIGSFVTGTLESDLALLQTFVTFDAIVTDSETSACTADRQGDCNAVSICLLVDMEPAAISGISEP